MVVGAQIYQEVIVVIVKKVINWKENAALMWTSVCHSNLVKAVASIFLEVIAAIAMPATRLKATNASVIIGFEQTETKKSGKYFKLLSPVNSFAINSHELYFLKCLIGRVFWGCTSGSSIHEGFWEQYSLMSKDDNNCVP